MKCAENLDHAYLKHPQSSADQYLWLIPLIDILIGIQSTS